MIISADSHIDLHWLPPTLFKEQARSDLKSRMPYVVESDKGPKWITAAGSNFGCAGGVGATGRAFAPGMSYRADKMAEAGLYADGQKGILRPTDPDRRVQDQDLDGIDAEVIYGMLMGTIWMRDDEAALEVARIYNDWLTDFCGHYPDRLIGLAVISGPRPEQAIAEVQAVAKRGGLRGIDLSGLSLSEPLYSAAWAGLWDVIEETGLPAHYHSTGPVVRKLENSTLIDSSRAKAIALANAGIEHSNGVLRELIMGGVLHARPNLKIVFAEAGIGWIPYILERMDQGWEDQYRDLLDLDRRPSEYWYNQCYATYQADDYGSNNLDAVGPANVMWASDFPHPDGLWPESLKYIDIQFAGVDPSTKAMVVGLNAKRLYGI